MTKLSIIVLSYNTKDVTLKCLESIKSCYVKQLKIGEFEIIVVDNASTDGTIEAVKNVRLQTPEHSDGGQANLKLIENTENVGFSKGCNTGAKQASGRYLFFLNSDTQIKDTGLLEMVAYLEKNENVGIIGAKMVSTNGTHQASAGKFYTLLNVFIMLFGGERLGLLRLSPQRLTSVDWVSGASLMIKKDLFTKLLGFDEHFFMYVEDMELCFRVKKEGYKVIFYPDISIVHTQLGSSNREFAILQIYKGLSYFYKKHANILEFYILRSMLFLKACLAFLTGILFWNKDLIKTYSKALKISMV